MLELDCFAVGRYDLPTCRFRYLDPLACCFCGLHHASNDPLLLLKREAGEHRERKHLGRCLLGDWEVTPTEAESLVGLREVKRDRVVDARSDAGGGQVRLEELAVCDPHYIEMVDRSRPGWNVWKDDRPLGVGEEPVVGACQLPALLVPFREVTKLHPQETRLDGVEPAVVSLHVVEVLLRLAVVA